MADIFVHIGLPKTGTTSIQFYLYSNRKELENLGVLYPSIYIPETTFGHHEIPWIIYGDKRLNKADFHDEQKSFYEYVEKQQDNVDKILISSETFWSSLIQEATKTTNFFKQLSLNYNTSLIMTVREFSQQLDSAYTHYLKNLNVSGSKIDKSFIEEFILRIKLGFTTLMNICEFIPPENFRVIDTTQKELTIEKFLSIINVKKSSLKEESDYKNERPFLEVLRLIGYITAAYPQLSSLSRYQKKIFFKSVNKYFNQNSQRVYSLLTPEESFEINSQVVDVFEQLNSITIDDLSCLIEKMKTKPVYSEAETNQIMNNLAYIHSPLTEEEIEQIQTLLINTLIN